MTDHLDIQRAPFGYPGKEGLYDPSLEKDACGVGLVAEMNGERSHKTVEDGIGILRNLEHRGAAGSDSKAGDGAGILTQIPHEFFSTVLESESISLPDEGDYGVGMLFLPPDGETIEKCQEIFNQVIAEEKQSILGWRRVPTDNSSLSKNMLPMEPAVYQVFVGRNALDVESFERKLFVIRRQVENKISKTEFEKHDFFYVCSLSAKTIVYKGMFLAYQLEKYYADLRDDRFKSAVALVHQRYSTNTFPTWGLAQPFRFLAHNGEINTVKGNINWARSRELLFASDYFGGDIKKLLPIIIPGGSDSASFDNFFELLVATGRSQEHAFSMMVPEAWENQKKMDPELRGFFEFHSSLMEPWDGPAAIMFTDGKTIGAGLDRNGLRPIRWVETHDGYFVMASEVGVLDLDIERIKEKGRLGPGQILVIDLEEGRIERNQEVKRRLSSQRPYRSWVDENKIQLENLPTPGNYSQPSHKELRLQQRVFGFTYEELYRVIKPMAVEGVEPTYSMGNDTPLAVLSKKAKLLYTYFKQHFAQVTNPAIDPIREELVMSLKSSVGGSYNIMEESPNNCRMLEIPHPVLTNGELEQLRFLETSNFRTITVKIGFHFLEKTLEQALDDLCTAVEEAVDLGYRMLILSDRCVEESTAPIPALLAVSAVHHDLIRKGKRGKIGIIVESGEVREVHHFAMLIGYGAGAINPYLAFESITQMEISEELPSGVDSKKASENYINAILKGLKKVFSKMGISTLASYQGAQIFEAIGLGPELIEKYFPGTYSVVGGIGIDLLEKEVRMKHLRAYAGEAQNYHKLLTSGEYAWRAQGEYHAYNPETISLLQEASRNNSYEQFKKFSSVLNDKNTEYQNLRSLLDFEYDQVTPVPLDEVEPVEEIFKRFVSGAMSIGSISREVHETLAIAMNRIGGKSNSGEGGEDAARFEPDANGDSRRSAIKQVASGRFGVTSHYLVNADELQIKVAQGAKPGEGGQLPGLKVDAYIGKIRHTIPGVTLISPPPHHDIYSIEDLAQLIFDLKNANPKAKINVKLVAESGVGTIAAGVSKALADIVTISGHDGGTGASPATSIKHAGLPWEIGLAETQQILVKNNLRGQIRVQVDGQIKTGREVVIAALLGAEEFGFATSALVVMGCIMMRKCHLNTCPVGIATQDKELRAKFTGKADHVVNFFTFIARETREYMAKLGFRKFEDMVGQVQLLKRKDHIIHWKADSLDFSKLLVKQTSREGAYHNVHSSPKLDIAMDMDLIKEASLVLEKGGQVSMERKIRNKDRTVGTRLGAEVSLRWGEGGLPDNSITVNFTGTAGQSFAAFLPSGITMKLRGDANDYVGKGLSGGKIIISSPEKATWKSSANMIAGNTLLYGATSGEAFFSGLVGERFAVRNSGATTVVEGIGDHGCEYMTGGIVVVLGETGKNFAAGMSGGVAYVYDRHKNFKKRCNLSMVAIEQLREGHHLDELHALIERHLELTHSKRATFLLNNWKKSIQDFVLVIPLEYRRILASRVAS